jgi:hypothetical protein
VAVTVEVPLVALVVLAVLQVLY